MARYKFKSSGASKASNAKPPADIRYRARPIPRGPKAKSKMQTVMHEFKSGNLRSGSKSGPVVTDRPQAIAIGLNQARKAMAKIRGY